MTRRELYGLCRVYQEFIDELVNSGAEQDRIDQVNDHLAAYKREYRAKAKETDFELPDIYMDSETASVVNYGGDWDGYWVKIFCKGSRWTEDQKKQFIMDNWISIQYEAWDCTGRTFTSRVSVFNVPDGVVAYIKYNRDV